MLTHFAEGTVAISIATAAAWVALRAPQQPAVLNTTVDELIDQLHPKLIKRIEHFGKGCYANDRAFFEAIGEEEGIPTFLHNSRLLVQICQRSLIDGHLSEADLKDPIERLEQMRRIARLAPIEEFVRARHIRRMPHLCAWTVADMYADLEATVEFLLGEHPDTLDRLRAVV